MFSKIIKPITIPKLLFIIITSAVTLITLSILTLFFLFLIFKNDISKTILLSANSKINGKVTFADVSFTPFKNFPSAALKLDDVTMYENKSSTSGSDNPIVLNVKHVYLSVNLIDLFSSFINISKITFEDGIVSLIVYPDGKTNIEKAVKNSVAKTETPNQKLTQNKKLTKKKDQQVLALNVNDFDLTDIKFKVDNRITKNRLSLIVNHFVSDFEYHTKKISSSVSVDLKIDSLVVNNKLLFSDENFTLESETQIDLNAHIVKIENGILVYKAAKFYLNGSLNTSDNGNINLTVKGSDKEFSLFSLFLSEEGMKNLEAGNVTFNANISGKIINKFPVTNVSFRLRNVVLKNPVTGRKITDLNLNSNFYSGNKPDLSEAKLNVENLSAKIKDGSLKLSGFVENFKSPVINLNILLSADVSGLDKIFNLGSITNLNGKIEIVDTLIAKYTFDDKKFVSTINKGKILFHDFGFEIPGTILFDQINGEIRRNNDDLFFYNLELNSKNTDILLNGDLKNVMYLFFGKEETITGNLEIKSTIFDLPNFLYFDPSIKRDFNHRILNAKIDVIAKTTTTKAINFRSFPQIEFEIKKLDATIENFLPRLKISSGLFKIYESDISFNLGFDKFKTDFLDGKFNITGEYSTSKNRPYYVKANIECNHISPSDMFYNKDDTIPNILGGKLSGKLGIELQFPQDSTLLKFINLGDADLVYQTASDTFTTKNLNIKLNSIYFNENENSNPLATLYTDGKFEAELLRSRNSNFQKAELELSVKNGKYEISSQMIKLFGDNAQGKSVLYISPFSRIPTYRIVYRNVKFDAEKMLSVFQEKPFVRGPLELNMELRSFGSKWDTIVNNTNGEIHLTGENLVLNGINTDELVDKFKRSQHFNLIDLGAVLLAGPVGIAVTKGTDFARILVSNSGKETTITKLISHWKVENGEFKIEDAAFTTEKNRIAIKGSIGFSEMNLNLTIALLNKYGCSVFKQEIFGNINQPSLGKVQVAKTLIAPVTNLIDDAMDKNCVPFYTGSLKDPTEEKK